ITNDTTLFINGTAEPNTVVEVFQDGNSLGTTTADNNGAWTFDDTSNVLADGTYTFTATATDLAGNTSDPSDGFLATVDTVAPEAPVVTSIQDDTGSSDTDGVTNDNPLFISGTSEPNSIVEVFQDGTSIGTTTADDQGAWTFDDTSNVLADGTYTFTA